MLPVIWLFATLVIWELIMLPVILVLATVVATLAAEVSLPLALTTNVGVWPVPPYVLAVTPVFELTSLRATTKLATLPAPRFVRLDNTPKVMLILEKLLSTSKLVRGEPLAVEPGLDIEPESLKIIVAI
jgi:hypothetical protein